MLLKNKIEIEEWLNKYHVKNYQLIEDEEYGYTVDVNGVVNLIGKNLKNIKLKFNIIDGWFDCSSNNLTSLKGCPEIVNKDFYCVNNKLTSLKYCPKIIKGQFDCSDNKLTSLKGCPEIVDSFYCQNNKLSLEEIIYLPKELTDDYIALDGNEKLGELQNITDIVEIKKILNIYQEKADLMKVVEVTDKSVESTGLVRTVENLKVKKV